MTSAPHGAADRLTAELSGIGPDGLVAAGDMAVDIAAGLGEQVWVVGLLGGGTLAGWLASERDEISSAVLIAPLKAPTVIPEFAVAPVSRAARVVPHSSVWRNNDLKDQLATPPYAYPRFTLRSLGAFLAVGRATQTTDPRRETPLERLVLVVNDNDVAVSRAGVHDVEGVDRIDDVFPAEDGYRHDVIDPQGRTRSTSTRSTRCWAGCSGYQGCRLRERPAPDAPARR